MLSFIHLSDIHFNKYSGDDYDVDSELRNELLLDIQNNYIKRSNSTTGILICGDIAFSGQKKEYETAMNFMKELSKNAQLEKEENVFCVPGNHDIDQAIPEKEVCVKILQSDLEAKTTQVDFDGYIANILRGDETKKVLEMPLNNFNDFFASKYSCYMQNMLTWSSDIPLDDKYTLRLWGINSTIISNSDDHKDRESQRPMRICSQQIPQRETDTVYLTLCHHPPEHWNDPENFLAKQLDERVAVQLYGHKHQYAIANDRTTLKIGSGATHPSRKEEGWIPRYNWIFMEIKSDDAHDYLKVIVYPRIYESGRFIPDHYTLVDAEYEVYDIEIGDRAIDSVFTDSPTDFTNGVNDTTWQRRFIFDFMNLPYLERNQIMGEFGLTGEEDAGKRHVELLEKIIKRAEKKDCIDRLLAAVAKRQRQGETLSC